MCEPRRCPLSAKRMSLPRAPLSNSKSAGPMSQRSRTASISAAMAGSRQAGNRGDGRSGASIMCPLLSTTLR